LEKFPVATIDFEASALNGEAIEVGIAIFDGQETIKVWSSLICPSQDCIWSKEAEKIHNISRDMLKTAPMPSRVAADLNRIMAEAGIHTAHCDGFEFDRIWMLKLFQDAGIAPEFSLGWTNQLPLKTAAELNRYLVYLRIRPIPHRAREDALRLMQAYMHAIGMTVRTIEVIK